MFRPTGLTLRAPLSKERGHLLDARPPLLCQGVSRAVLLASSITERKSAARKQRTYRPTSLRGESAPPKRSARLNAYTSPRFMPALGATESLTFTRAAAAVAVRARF